jgi:hypothetical protein
MSSDAAAIPATTSVRWSDLLPELLGRVIAHLPYPAADLSSFRAVCRAWRAAALQHARQLPWIVLPDGSMCIIGDDGARDLVAGTPACPRTSPASVPPPTAGSRSIAPMMYSDALLTRTSWSTIVFFYGPEATILVLYNPFSGVTVPLPELDSLVGHVAETFQIRNALK